VFLLREDSKTRLDQGWASSGPPPTSASTKWPPSQNNCPPLQNMTRSTRSVTVSQYNNRTHFIVGSDPQGASREAPRTDSSFKDMTRDNWGQATAENR
jgi:hypothetical protein